MDEEPRSAEDDRDRLIVNIEEAMPGETVWTRAYGTVQIAPEPDDLADALLAAGWRLSGEHRGD